MVASTRCTSAWVLGSSVTTFTPSASSLSPARDETDITTTSGRRATMASMLGSSPPPTLGSFCTLAG